MIRYRFEDPEYVLFDGETGDILARMPEVAIAFSISNDDLMWTLHKHGAESKVERWLSTTQKKFRDAGHKDIASKFTMITGKFPVELINRCLDTSGYIKKLCEEIGIAEYLIDAAKCIDASGRIRIFCEEIDTAEYSIGAVIGEA